MTTGSRRQWNAVCDRCGFEYKNWQLKKEWTGLMTCSGPETNDCWEPRHPSDFIKAHSGESSIPWSRPEPTDVYVSVTFTNNIEGCIPAQEYCQAEYMAAGCAIVGKLNPSLTVTT